MPQYSSLYHIGIYIGIIQGKKNFPFEVFTCFRHDSNTLGDLIFMCVIW